MHYDIKALQMELTQIIGITAGILTATSLIPQLVKIIKDRKADDVSPMMLIILMAGLALWTSYGIMKQVERESQGKVKMGPGTLYGSLGRMMEAGLIREWCGLVLRAWVELTRESLVNDVAA